ncbi:MAG: FxsA family protein [Sulfurovum sp.]|nr:FxsA family protein [Sulfurovum sp.]
MIFVVIPFFLLELYFSLQTGEEIGFFWTVVWILLSFVVGMRLLKKSQHTMLGNIEAMKQGKLDMQKFKNANLSYFIGAILLIIPGVFSDFLGVSALIYTYYLQFMVRITPEQPNKHFNPQGDDNVIDVEIIDEYSRSDRNS